MYNLLSVELFKLRKDRAFRTLMLILAIIALLYPWFSYFTNKSNGEPIVPGVAFLFDSIGLNSILIKLCIAILAGFFIASEYSTGVMKTIASSGNSRSRLFVAKMIGFIIGAMALAVVFPAVSTIEATLLGGFSHSLPNATSVIGELPTDVSAVFILRTLGLTLLYSASFAAVAALFSTLLTESGKAIGFSLVFFILIDTLLEGLGNYFPVMQTIYDYSIFKLIENIGMPVMEASPAPIMLVPLLTIAVTGMLGILAYRRKEIK